MLLLAVSIFALSVFQLIFYQVTSLRLKNIEKKIDFDQVADEAIRIKEIYSRRNLKFTLIILFLSSTLNIFSVIGGDSMKKEIKIDLTEHFNQFRNEEIMPMTERISKIEAYLFPPGGPTGGFPEIIKELQLKVDNIEKRIVRLQGSVNKNAISMEELNNIKMELDNLKELINSISGYTSEAQMHGY